ncbi:hypothetical protein [Campylobacter jejuni]|uniref:hypothetical protein n=1 Tax=Campylobacter jejuni TaxID=197 RepID=UPI00178CA142|nr:hypothetical protein [Campylobacter jejuni]
MFKIKTTPKVVSLWSRALQKAVSYFLDLKNIFLISSLKSVINTAVTAMNVFRKSIVDYFLGVISSRIPNLIAKKKSSTLFKNRAFITPTRLCKTFVVHLPHG